MRSNRPHLPLATAGVALAGALLAGPALGASAADEAASSLKDRLPDVTIRLVAAPGWESQQSAGDGPSDTFEMEGGLGTLATVGAGDKQSWHGEAELGLRRTAGSGGIALADPITTFSLMANGYFGFKISDKFNGYAGIGVGVAMHREERRGSDTSFGYQLMAGVGYKLTKKITANVGLRYFATQAASLGRIRVEYGRPEVEVGIGFEF